MRHYQFTIEGIIYDVEVKIFMADSLHFAIKRESPSYKKIVFEVSEPSIHGINEFKYARKFAEIFHEILSDFNKGMQSLEQLQAELKTTA